MEIFILFSSKISLVFLMFTNEISFLLVLVHRKSEIFSLKSKSVHVLYCPSTFTIHLRTRISLQVVSLNLAAFCCYDWSKRAKAFHCGGKNDKAIAHICLIRERAKPIFPIVRLCV
jgi:hypothetical protein